jgi:excisionase family DNA binding protein
MTKPELLDTESAAEYLGLKGHTLEVWRSTGRYDLPFVRLGRRIKYRRADLDAFLERCTVNTAEAA